MYLFVHLVLPRLEFVVARVRLVLVSAVPARRVHCLHVEGFTAG